MTATQATNSTSRYKTPPSQTTKPFSSARRASFAGADSRWKSLPVRLLEQAPLLHDPLIVEVLDPIASFGFARERAPRCRTLLEPDTHFPCVRGRHSAAHDSSPAPSRSWRRVNREIGPLPLAKRKCAVALPRGRPLPSSSGQSGEIKSLCLTMHRCERLGDFASSRIVADENDDYRYRTRRGCLKSNSLSRLR